MKLYVRIYIPFSKNDSSQEFCYFHTRVRLDKSGMDREQCREEPRVFFLMFTLRTVRNIYVNAMLFILPLKISLSGPSWTYAI
jgi:hypothetical protein